MIDINAIKPTERVMIYHHRHEAKIVLGSEISDHLDKGWKINPVKASKEIDDLRNDIKETEEWVAKKKKELAAMEEAEAGYTTVKNIEHTVETEEKNAVESPESPEKKPVGRPRKQPS